MTLSADRCESAHRALAAQLGPRCRRDVPLGALTTYRVGGNAAIFVEAETVDDLAVTARLATDAGVPIIVIGRGSNMLVADSGFDGIAISVAALAAHIDLQRPGLAERHIVAAGGGVELPRLARQTAAAALTGFEWAVGVPGSVGGAVRMNAGGHGSDIAACLIDVDVFDLAGPERGRFAIGVDGIGLRFRASDLAPGYIVLEARLQLAPGDAERSKAEIRDIVAWRREHQPGGQNCGSVFVNPVPGEVTSGGLIDALGLRGFRVGTAWVSEKHANFVQAGDPRDGATASDVRAVIEAVRERVAAETGYRLRSEVRLVGFGDVDPLSFQDTTP